METTEKWEIIATQRRVMADLLDELTDPEWETPSLCQAWRIRDVAAHVALPPGRRARSTSSWQACAPAGTSTR